MRRWTSSCLSCVHSSPAAVQPGIWRRNRKDGADYKSFFNILIHTTNIHNLFGDLTCHSSVGTSNFRSDLLKVFNLYSTTCIEFSVAQM